jgi:hypothetical protein
MRIANLRSVRTDTGGGRVEADVDGEPLWFASEDATLTACSEAFASALLISAATRGEALEIDGPVDRSWLERTPAIIKLAKEWWQLPGTHVIAGNIIDRPRTQPGATAQCFTCGVDSFHALIHAKTPPAMLVYLLTHDRRAHGYIIPAVRETAAAFGAKAVLIYSNLLTHGASRGSSFLNSHGGALAALGHLLSEDVERIVIPSSYPYHDPKPWGSHWDLDHLWSSRRLAVEHADATLRRDGKVRAIVDHEAARRYLHVCTRRTYAGQSRNCSRCEKCVRTMIALAMCGRLDDCRTFDHMLPLECRVDGLAVLDPHLVSVYEELLCGIEDPKLRAAVERLISHSRGRPAWLYKDVIRRRRRPTFHERDGFAKHAWRQVRALTEKLRPTDP